MPEQIKNQLTGDDAANTASADSSMVDTEGLPGGETSAPSNQLEAASALSSDPVIGTVLINQYRIDSELGAGGWATVYRAHQLSLGDDVAVKVLHSGLANSDVALKRIEQEAKVLSRIDSQYVVKTLDYGVSNSYPFLVMEYFDGVPLSDYLKSHGTFDTASGIEILQQLCDGLSSAHRLGLIHRDMKPANILLKTNPELRAKIIDFGIAKLFEEGSEDLTKSSEILGSPPYMAPEQWSKGSLDSRVDIYALGCVAYEMFSNKQAFTAQSTYEYLRLHASEDPAPFPAGLKVPKDLQRIIFKCMQKDPKDRYQSTDEINSDLAKLKSGRKLKIVLRRNKAQQSRQRILIAASILAGAALLSFGLWTNRQAILIPLCVEENNKGDRFVKAGAPLKAIPHYRSVVFWSPFLDKQDRRSLHAMRMLAQNLRSNGSFAEATDLENKVYAAVGATVNPTNRLKLETALDASQNSLADLAHARNLAMEQMQQAESSIGKHSMSYADGLMAIAMLADPGDAKKAAAQLQESIKITEDLMESDDWALGIRYIHLGQLYANLNRLEDAKIALSKGLSVAIKTKNALEICNAYVTLAILEIKLNNPQKAIGLLQIADDHYRKTVGGDSPQIWYISAQAFKKMNQGEKYIRALHKAMSVAEAHGHSMTKIQASRDLAVAYFKQGRYLEARKFSEITIADTNQYGSDNVAAETARMLLRRIDEILKSEKSQKSDGTQKGDQAENKRLQKK